jgi:hypothetical protein
MVSNLCGVAAKRWLSVKRRIRRVCTETHRGRSIKELPEIARSEINKRSACAASRNSRRGAGDGCLRA